tara:strand:- start:66 stop:263 length:198 start_codon:yes stop_codon:yes gene_type:complete
VIGVSIIGILNGNSANIVSMRLRRKMRYLHEWLDEIDKVDDEEKLIDIQVYVEARLIKLKSKEER